MIKNLDGTPYTLEGPNPLMKEQENFKDFVLHNFNWKPEVKEKTTVVVPIQSDFNVKELELKSEPKAEPSKIVEKVKSNEPASNVTRVHCLPVKIEKKVDELYGETRSISTWGNPFLFEAVILDQNDFMMVFWTNIEIELDSVVYPANRDKRWWRINQSQEKEGGYLYNGLPSDIQPDFT